MTMIYLTADLHLNHKNIIKYCNRPYFDLHNMNFSLIQNWNSVVNHGDAVYILGDFGFFDNDLVIKKYVEQLKGNKILITGNHDRKTVKNCDHFKEITNYKKINYDKKTIIMFHYPIASWDRKHHGSYHAYGHCHGVFKNCGLSHDVGVDNNNYTPISIIDFFDKCHATNLEDTKNP